MALLSLRKRNEVDEIRNRVTYVEMNVNQEFMNEFSAAKFIPHTDRTLVSLRTVRTSDKVTRLIPELVTRYSSLSLTVFVFLVF